MGDSDKEIKIIPKKQKRLRKLVAGDNPPVNVAAGKLIAFRTIGICFLIAVVIGLATTHPNAFHEFIRSYREQYHLMVYGTSNYCSRLFNFKDLLRILRENVYGQEKALDKIERIFRLHGNLSSVAIVGTAGVGKTYFINLVRNYYPWKDNVHHYVWSTYSEKDEDKFDQVNQFISKLSTCGHNIILIDDLLPKDKDFVLEYQHSVEKALSNSSRSIKLTVVYVFHIPRYSEASKTSYQDNMKYLENLGNIKTVIFNELTDLDVEKCIRKISSDLNVRLTQKQILDILRSIDVIKVGCKTVHAKITKYSEYML